MLTLLSACSLFNFNKKIETTFSVISDKKGSDTFSLSDRSGNFLVSREFAFKKSTNEFILKKSISLDSNPEKKQNSASKKIVEKSITISTSGVLKKTIPALRPKISQYTVWFDGQKYFTEMKTNTKTKSLDITMRGPELQWNGKKSVPFPPGMGIYCFFNQLVECIQATSFFTKAAAADSGMMNLHIIWDGYPYLQEQYLEMPAEVFTAAELSFDGYTENDEIRFSLTFANQVIFYVFEHNGALAKMFWVSQGFSMIKRDSSTKDIADDSVDKKTPTPSKFTEQPLDDPLADPFEE
ncbi:MAG: hypothetical protein A2504_16250 [Bdellovibrionales bacterium RIFOXYD12_FULL_39_22]|nr:MAG: hypothetical protein A2385_08160 [Bdellovibrionales bacterium RIFOXYB1_FULL_39_21]OFZ42969.1 MAG: hypothetical protein A2485_11065 [Bdellovibrionales bacterium RIFOXYC12_FULL_39_17]OFZ50945.1 MAG: hypothetical protein A2404_07075 [Bdellovibrionales bacterium RIFOXYC1_FULL_39_130]OFZ78168.1 MAG: hypothetical protein A2560_02245 [Bdellovibrionales bacterium RIFOXYD1_FULL_39_84]OFZ94036.1 MAG: hypothetical protein A2504_16250 [Bdellovibrionales bacterium RIFOXYD12_FULL_39_22]